jgi:hypothetical protein
VFVQTGDPVVAGFVESFARPNGNATVFAQFEYLSPGNERPCGGRAAEKGDEIAPAHG